MKPDLTIIIPCRNEHQSIRKVVREVDVVMYHHGIPGEIFIVDDSSEPPHTTRYLGQPGLHRSVRLYRNILGPGLAEALRTGITYADSKYVIFMSGDGTDDPRALPLYYKRLCDGYDCVFGQRKWRREFFGNRPPFQALLSRLGNRLISLFFNRRYSDYTDMFKGYRLSVIYIGLACQSKGFSFPMELCLRAILSGARYSIVPISTRRRISGRSKFRLRHEAPEYLMTLWRCLKLKYRGK